MLKIDPQYVTNRKKYGEFFVFYAGFIPIFAAI